MQKKPTSQQYVKKQYQLIKKLSQSQFSKKQLWKLFFFPLAPVKVFKSISLIVILAALISLGLILSWVNIPIPLFGISLGFGNLASLTIGWFFGPIYGLLMGAVIDTLAFLMQGGVWFWLYAIQEPIIGFLGGLIGSCYQISKKFGSFKIDFICFEIIFNLFLILTYVLMLNYVQGDNNVFNGMVNNGKISQLFASVYQWVLLGLLLVFYLVIQIIVIYKYRINIIHQHYYKLSIFMYAAITCVICTCIFSFILGPISAVEYFVYLNGQKPSSLLKYGLGYYLLPRVIKESFKTPIYILLYSSLIMMLSPLIQRIKTKIQNSW